MASERDQEQQEHEEEDERLARLDNQEAMGDEKIVIDYDAVLAIVGGWGWFQRVLYHALCLPVIFSTLMMFNIQVFASAIPNFRCRNPTCDIFPNASFEDAKKFHFDSFTIPNGTEDGQCKIYRFLNVSKAPSPGPACDAANFDPLTTEPCTSWLYDRDTFKNTFIAEMNLVCDDSWKVPVSQSVFFGGVFVAALSLGLLADRFGRRHVTMSSYLLLAVSSLALIFVHDYFSYLAMTFLVAIGQTGAFLIPFILSMEIVGAEKRVYCGIAIEVFFVAGEILASGLAYWLRDWRTIVTVAIGPIFLFLLYWPILPESTRWLLSRKKYDEAQKVTNRISYWNRAPVVNIKSFRVSVPEAPRNVEKEETMLDLIKDFVHLKRLIIQCYTWLVIVLGYYGLSLSSVSLSGDPYLNFFAVSLVELPGYLISWWMMEKLGRRKTMVQSLVVAGVSLIANGIVDISGYSDHPVGFWFNLIAFLVGKCGLTVAFSTAYVYSSELFPTPVRTAGVGMCSTAGRLGAIVTPFVSIQVKQRPWVAMMVFGCSALIAGATNLFLPETLGQPLPETLLQAKHVGRSRGSSGGANINESAPLLGSH